MNNLSWNYQNPKGKKKRKQIISGKKLQIIKNISTISYSDLGKKKKLTFVKVVLNNSNFRIWKNVAGYTRTPQHPQL